MHAFGGMGFGMFWGWLIGIAVLAFIIWFFTGTANTRNPGQQPDDKSALDILKEKYARGELNREEFLDKKKTLINS